MKHFTQICLLSFMTCNSVAAQPFGDPAKGYRIVRQDYRNGSGEVSFTAFDYNQQGILWRAFWCLTDSSRYSLNHYTTDEQGNLVAAFRDFSDGVTTFEYFDSDSLGHKTFESFHRSDGASGNARYTWNNGLMTKAALRKFKGWLSGDLIPAYDANGRKTDARLMKDDTLVATIAYTYDEQGNLSHERWDFGRRWFQEFAYTYQSTTTPGHYYTSPLTKVAPGFRISEEGYTFNNEKGGPSGYTYDQHGQMATKLFERSDGVTTTTRYEHDNHGRITRSVRQFENGNTEEFRYRYNTAGQLIFRGCYLADSLTGYESWRYTPAGDLEAGRLVNADGWLTGNLTFKGKRPGYPDQALFTADNGSSASIRFRYDSHGNTTTIHWLFSFGKFQRYTFMLQPD